MAAHAAPSPNDSTHSTLDPVREISGRAVVVGLMLFGILATCILWFYWKLHVMPFMPLQLALEQQFENSSPRVEGGQAKIHKQTPTTLRVVMRVGFDPVADESAAEEFLAEVVTVVTEHLRLEDYEQLELHMYQPHPEQQLRQRTMTRDVDELLPVSDSRDTVTESAAAAVGGENSLPSR